jgi:hypothetical protein
MWENSVREWVSSQRISDDVEVDDVDKIIKIELKVEGIRDEQSFNSDEIVFITANITDKRNITGEIFINNEKVSNLGVSNNSFIFMPQESNITDSKNTLEVIVKDGDGNEYSEIFTFYIN